MIDVCAEDFEQIVEWQRTQQAPTAAAIEANRLFYSLRAGRYSGCHSTGSALSSRCGLEVVAPSACRLPFGRKLRPDACLVACLLSTPPQLFRFTHLQPVKQ